MQVGIVAAVFASACSEPHEAYRSKNDSIEQEICATHSESKEALIDGGDFQMGANPEQPEEGPSRLVSVKPFWIDVTEVTNQQFAQFVEATGYITLAERTPDPALYPGVPRENLKPSSLVFVGAGDNQTNDVASWWRVVEGANWRRPEGPQSALQRREFHPVVHVGFEDALAYAKWRGRDLPTEAEWEFAARAAIPAARFEWGNEQGQVVRRANTWQGPFPAIDAGEDGYKARTAPVGCFEASAYGLYDMTGNVWEWTTGHAEWLGDNASRVIKGGSFLCADNYCLRYRPAARQAGPPDTGSSHIGFRTVRR